MSDNMLSIGTLLRGGTYRVEKQLASGGFGNTYVVKNLNFNETYAMKEFFMKGINLRDGDSVTVSVPDNRATFESQREKFKKEAQRLRKINSSHIVKVHDLFEENDTIYYVMDYIEGKSLFDIMKERGNPFSEHEALEIFNQVLDALQVIHNQNPQILHLDIKPSNLLKDNSGNIWLIDFGSCKLLDEGQGITVSSGITLTKGYAPSELEDGKIDRIGPWTDLYELGATFYNLISSIQPPTPSEILEESVNVFKYPIAISNDVQELIKWLMAPNRRNRPQSISEIYSRVKRNNLQKNENEDTIYSYELQKKKDHNNIASNNTINRKTRFKFFIYSLVLLIFSCVIYLSFLSDNGAKGIIVISEVMTNNDGLVPDGDGNNKAWIEFGNVSSDFYNLRGMYITTDRSVLNPSMDLIQRKDRMCRIPTAFLSTNLGGHKKIAFFCDPTLDYQKEYHLKLEIVPSIPVWLALYDKNGVELIDSVSIPALATNQSYARDGNTWKTCDQDNVTSGY